MGHSKWVSLEMSVREDLTETVAFEQKSSPSLDPEKEHFR